MNKKLNCSGIMFFAEHFKQGLVIGDCLFRSFYFVAAWPQIKLCPTSTSAAVAAAAAALTPSIQSNITVFETPNVLQVNFTSVKTTSYFEDNKH